MKHAQYFQNGESIVFFLPLQGIQWKLYIYTYALISHNIKISSAYFFWFLYGEQP